MANYYDNSPVQKITGEVSITNDPVPVSGTVSSIPPAIKISTTTKILASETAVTLAAANLNRKQLWVYNTGSVLYVGLGTVSTTSYFLKMDSGGYWELPTAGGIYVGDLVGIWAPSSASGEAQVTEVR